MKIHLSPVQLFLILISLLSLVSVFLVFNQTTFLWIDENTHYDQIRLFIEGSSHLNTTLMTIPGYHVIIAGIAILLNLKGISEVRIIAFLINLAVIPSFFLVAREIDRKSALIKTVQLTFLPILFVFFPLIYTDITSLTFILLSLFFMLRKKYFFSVLVGFVSVLIRQNNIFFLFFFNILFFMQNKNISITSKLKSHLFHSFILIVAIIVFISFVAVNKVGLVSPYSQSWIHFSSSNLGNWYYFLFILLILFPFHHIHAIWKGRSRIISPIILLLLMMFAVLFFLTFKNDHPFNQNPWFIRNVFLNFADKEIAGKVIFGVGTLVGLLSIFLTPFRKKSYYLLYPTIFIYLFPYWLIETRYYFIPLALWLLFRKGKIYWYDFLTVVFYIALSFFVTYAVIHTWFFL